MAENPYLFNMKTTVELDEGRLLRVMKLGRFKTRREAINFALVEAERTAKIRKLFETPWTTEEMEGAVDSRYDVMVLRENEKPHDHAGR